MLSLEESAPLSERLAALASDPTVEVRYRLDRRRGIGGATWIDREGRGVAEPVRTATRAVAFVDRDGEHVAAISYDGARPELPRLVEESVSTLSLALEYERLRAELEAETRLAGTLAETAPSLLSNVDTDGRMLRFNAATLRASGFAHEDELRGKFFWDVFIDETERDAMKARFGEAAPDFPRSEYENTFTNARGERLVIYWHSAPVLADDGTVVSIAAGGLDVTERHWREEETRASEERFRAVIDRAPVAIFEVDLDLRVKLWNPAAERIFGWPAEEVVGQPVPVVPPEHEAEFRELLARIEAGQAFTGVETVRMRRDGSRVHVELSGAPIRDAAGAVVGYMAVFGDISDRKLQEEELRASRARIVAAGDDERRRLERNLHDGAQQRLVALSVSLRLAENKLRDDPVAGAALLVSAREELMHALEELRELARGIHPAILTDRGLQPAIEALVARVPVPVHVDVVSDKPLPAAVAAASYYVIAEALTNVAKYAGASEARVRIARDDGRVVIEVADDGAGGADPARGSGLRGLADRVAALDGALFVESPKGTGTRVRAEIPLGDVTLDP